MAARRNALFSFHPGLLRPHQRRAHYGGSATASKKKRKSAGTKRKTETGNKDVISALRNLGYKATDAKAAARGASGNDFDSQLRSALGSLRRNPMATPRKRKNAGLGYGYAFSGAFSKKADAVKKEKKRKGSFIKATMYPNGLRYAVMTPRTNPAKKRKKKASFAQEIAHEVHKLMTNPQTNPVAELVVMGANPGAAMCGKPTGGGPCTRAPRHRGPHLPQGATMRTAARLPKGWRGKQAKQVNPSAEALRETFTGTRANKVSVMHEPHMRAGDYAKLGDLLALYVKPMTGGQVIEMKFKHGEKPMLVSGESARQMYFVGGQQDVQGSLVVFGAEEINPGVYELGEVRRIDYKQRKEHVPQPELDEWKHKFGENTGVLPTLLFDVFKERLLLEGGEYEIRAEGIVN